MMWLLERGDQCARLVTRLSQAAASRTIFRSSWMPTRVELNVATQPEHRGRIGPHGRVRTLPGSQSGSHVPTSH
jgi:hypothetical protein